MINNSDVDDTDTSEDPKTFGKIELLGHRCVLQDTAVINNV